MRHCLSLLAVATALCSGGLLPAWGADIKPIRVAETDCKSTAVLGVSPDGKRVFCFDYWTLTQIDLSAVGKSKTVPLPHEFRGEQRIYTGTHVQEDIWLLAVGRVKKGRTQSADREDNRYILFDFATNTVKADWPAHPGMWCANLVIAPKQNRIVETGCHGLNDVWLWNLKTGKKVAEMNVLEEWRLKEKPLGGLKQRTAIDPTSSFLAIGLVDGGMVQVWDLDNKTWRPVFPRQKGVLLYSLIFLDERTLAVVWREEATGRECLEVHECQLKDIQLGNVVIRPRGSKLLFRADAKGNFSDLAASPDGQILALENNVNQRESRIRLWDVAARREVAAFKDDDIEAMTFTHDGKRLITSGSDGKIKVWDVEQILKPSKP